jgi:hypothetical protein
MKMKVVKMKNELKKESVKKLQFVFICVSVRRKSKYTLEFCLYIDKLTKYKNHS